MGANDLESKVEEALASVVTAQALSGLNVHTGLDEDNLNVPYVICMCAGQGEEVLRDSGTFKLEAVVKVVSSADDETLAEHRSRLATVRDSIMDSGIAATLTAAVSEFHVYDVELAGLGAEFEDRKYSNSLELNVTCCASDIG